MAFVSVGFQLSVTLIDTGGDSSVKTYDLRGADADEAATNAAAFLTDLQAATLCVVTRYSISTVFAQDALVLPTSAGARNSMQAVVSGYIADNPSKRASAVIPGPVADVFVATSGPNSDIVDVADATVTAFMDNFKAAGTVFISDGEDLDVNPGLVGYRRTTARRLA